MCWSRLHEADVRQAVEALRAQGVSAIAVCYLFSFLNPAHERRTRDLIAELAPDMSVSLSSEVDPTFREYERSCVTAFDAYLGPVVKRYLAGLAETLRGLGVPGVPLIMRSRGGIVSAALAAQQPVTLFLSGPAGGVIGAAFAAGRSGVRDFVSLDMGGTSNDVALVRDGRPLLVGEGAIGPYPVRTPMVDVNTIGAGGGSIAWIDARRRLAGGAAQRRRRAGARLLRARRRRGHRDRRQRRARLPEPRALRRRRPDASTWPPRSARSPSSAAGWASTRSRRRPASIVSSTPAWRTRSAW